MAQTNTNITEQPNQMAGEKLLKNKILGFFGDRSHPRWLRIAAGAVLVLGAVKFKAIRGAIL